MNSFQSDSLRLLADRLASGPYPGYPTERLYIAAGIDRSNPVVLPAGPWDIPTASDTPDAMTHARLQQQGVEFDASGRPLHPWLDAMITDPNVGVVTGKGKYWSWGPNYTADPIVIRRDLDEPHVLLIKRGDGTGWALPGGFVDKGEMAQAAAIREAKEESGIDVMQFNHSVSEVYKGVLSDLRATANAWPETTAYCIELNLGTKADQKRLADMMAQNRRERLLRSIGRFAFRGGISRIPWQGGDDAERAAWVPVAQCSDILFGSHSLLVAMAKEKEQWNAAA